MKRNMELTLPPKLNFWSWYSITEIETLTKPTSNSDHVRHHRHGIDREWEVEKEERAFKERRGEIRVGARLRFTQEIEIYKT